MNSKECISLKNRCLKLIANLQCEDLSKDRLKYLPKELQISIFNQFSPNSLLFFENQHQNYEKVSKEIWIKFLYNFYISNSMNITKNLKNDPKSSFLFFYYQLILEESEVDKLKKKDLAISFEKFEEIERNSMICSKLSNSIKVINKIKSFEKKEMVENSKFSQLVFKNKLDVTISHDLKKQQYISIEKLSKIYSPFVKEMQINLLDKLQAEKILMIKKHLKNLKNMHFFNLRDDNFHFVQSLLSDKTRSVSFKYLILSKESQQKFFKNLTFTKQKFKGSKQKEFIFDPIIPKIENKILKTEEKNPSLCNQSLQSTLTICNQIPFQHHFSSTIQQCHPIFILQNEQTFHQNHSIEQSIESKKEKKDLYLEDSILIKKRKKKKKPRKIEEIIIKSTHIIPSSEQHLSSMFYHLDLKKIILQDINLRENECKKNYLLYI